mmetsp:Transcript_35431/g.55271  ORF Transcript_35431/g.55271 Transcript_35431/m.55271 type:complete len:178 (-) Transcript_35431:182-715(-)
MYEYKICILGNQSKRELDERYSVGSYSRRYNEKTDSYFYPATQDDLNNYRKYVTFHKRDYMLEVISYSSISEQFTAMRDLYIKNAAGFLLVYNIIHRSSFDAIFGLIDLILRVKDADYVPIIGNMSDLEDQRIVEYEEGEEAAKKFGCSFVEVSAKNEHNLDHVLYELILQIENCSF